MKVIASKRKMAVMLVPALILWSSIGIDAGSTSCKMKCALSCAAEHFPVLCIFKCLKRCPEEFLTSSVSKHCDVDCFLATCLDYHSVTEKVGVDVKKVGACADSCSQDCQKSYPLK